MERNLRAQSTTMKQLPYYVKMQLD